MCGCAEGAGLADHHQLPGGEPGCGRPAGGHLGDALGGVPRGECSQARASHVTMLVLVFPDLLACWAQMLPAVIQGLKKEGELLSSCHS